MSRCGFLDVFANSPTKRRDKSIEDRGANGIFPQLGIEEIFAFDIIWN